MEFIEQIVMSLDDNEFTLLEIISQSYFKRDPTWKEIDIFLDSYNLLGTVCHKKYDNKCNALRMMNTYYDKLFEKTKDNYFPLD